VVRFFIVRAHYRSPLNYSDQHLDDARQALTRLYTALKAVPAQAGNVDWNEPQAARFHAAMNDDFNTPEAMAVLFDLANELNKTHKPEDARLLKSLGAILGLLQRDSITFLQAGHVVLVHAAEEHDTALPVRAILGSAHRNDIAYSAEKISQLIAARAAARKSKNFAESDRIRDELLGAGIVLEDGPAGTTWRRK